MKNDQKTQKNERRNPPARTPEEQEQRMINLSMMQAEKMLEEGRAPAQVVVHFLRLGTEKAKLENEKLKAETEMTMSKSEMLKSQKRMEELYVEVTQAFKNYGGGSGVFNDDEEYSE